MIPTRALWITIKQGLLLIILSAACGIASADLNFSFNAASQASRPGESFQVEWIVINDGANQENNVSVEVPMPGSGINYISEGRTMGGNCTGSTCDPGETIVWALGNIPAGESRMASFALNVKTTAPNGNISIEGRVLAGSSTVSSMSWPQAVSVASVAELMIDSSDASVGPGSSFSYGILAGNSGTAPLNGATLTVPVPPELTINSAPDGSVSGNTVTWNLGNLSAGRVTRRVINVTPNSGLGTGDLIVLNDAILNGTVFGVAQQTTADHVVTVGNPALKFEIRAQETQFRPGEAQHIEFVVSNTTNQVMQNTSVSLLYPQKMNYVSEAETLGGNCDGSTCDPGEQMTWSFGNLLPGETRQVRFKTLAPSGADDGQPVRWQASARTGLNIVRRDYLATGISPVDINLQIDSDESRVSAGGVYTYTFHVGNVGVSPMGTVILDVPIPPEVSVLESYGGTILPGSVRWVLTNVFAGTAKHLYLKVKANNGLAKGRIINLIDAQAKATVFGIAEASMAQHFVSVGDSPIDLELRVQQAAAKRGEALTMEIVASNTGTQVEQSVVAKLLYPDDINYTAETNLESAYCVGSTCDPGEQMTIPFGNLVPGETKSIVVPLKTKTTASLGEHTTWMGNVSAAGGLSRRFEATVAITELAPELLITTDELLVAAGTNVNYKISSGNTGGGILSQSVLTVPVPAGMSVVASPGGSVQNGRVVYNLGDIEDINIVNSSLTLKIPSGTSNGAQFALENVELSGSMFGVQQMAYANHVITVGSSPIAGQISVVPVDPRAGDAVDITIDVSNTGSQVEQGVTAFLRYPSGVLYKQEASMDGGNCPGSTCDPGEGVSWALGNLIPGESRELKFSTTVVAGFPEGDMIEWSGRVAASDLKQRRIEFGTPVGVVVVVVTPKYCNGQTVTVDLSLGQSATSGDDVIRGTTGADVIYALGGNDVICALGGADTIIAGNGNDWVDAGFGHDEVQGGNGVDIIFGNSGNDELYGGPDNDEIHGGEGHDILFGNSGSDIIHGGNGVDKIKGGSGNDVITTGSGATVGSGVIVDGGAGNDTITGGVAADEIRGSSGNDIIYGSDGNDRLFGGGGEDLINGQGGDDFIRGNAANDTLNGGTGDDNIDGGGSKDTIMGGAGNDSLSGSTGNDIIRGQSGNDTINGGGGDDQLFGDSGSDLLLGGGSNDAMDGGGGIPDTCDGQTGIDTATAACEFVLGVP